MSEKKFVALIDETGSAGGTAQGNRYFALGATIMHSGGSLAVHQLLEDIRRATGRRSGDVLHFKNFKPKKGLRGTAARYMDSSLLLHAATVSDKSAHGASNSWTHDDTYFWVITLLLERLSWMAEAWDAEMDVILAHKRHMTKAKLGGHEARLRNGRGATLGHRINWSRIPRPIKIGTPQSNEFLQLADIFASSVGASLNGEGAAGVINTNYVRALAPRLYRGPNNKLQTYGFKVHPPASCPPWVSGI